MQPLSYQPTDTTCWLTCMLNGILFLGKGKRICPTVYSLLHTLQASTGVDCWNDSYEHFKNITRCMEALTGLQIFDHWERDVEGRIQELSFKNQVAICDIHNGDHSILLNGREGDWINCFDPYWDHINRISESGEYQMVSGGLLVNLKINQKYLLHGNHAADFQIGRVNARCLVVIQAKP